MAKNRQAAFQARVKVTVNYKNEKRPVLDIKESVNKQLLLNEKVSANLAFPCRGINEKVATDILQTMKEKAKKLESDVRSEKFAGDGDGSISIKGEFVTRGQYHFHMETQTCLCVPREDGMDVYSSTQSMDNVQAAIAAALGKSCNRLV